jgi:MFS family permease
MASTENPRAGSLRIEYYSLPGQPAPQQQPGHCQDQAEGWCDDRHTQKMTSGRCCRGLCRRLRPASCLWGAAGRVLLAPAWEMLLSCGERLVQCSLTAALAGFLFGFDTIVISGAEQRIQAIWELDGAQHGLCMSAALWGTLAGALCGGWPAERYGRRPTLLWVGLVYVGSSLASSLAAGPMSFAAARFTGGVGVGVATIASPLYITEISPPEFRGRLTGLFQLNIVLGILLAFLSNAVIGWMFPPSISWRVMLGVMAIPSAVYVVLCLAIPESPRWLLAHEQVSTHSSY